MSQKEVVKIAQLTDKIKHLEAEIGAEDIEHNCAIKELEVKVKKYEDRNHYLAASLERHQELIRRLQEARNYLESIAVNGGFTPQKKIDYLDLIRRG